MGLLRYVTGPWGSQDVEMAPGRHPAPVSASTGENGGGHCAQAVRCPGKCACGDQVKDEMGDEGKRAG